MRYEATNFDKKFELFDDQRYERKGIRAIRIDAELLSKRTSLGRLHRNEAKIAAAITFAHEAAAAWNKAAAISRAGRWRASNARSRSYARC
jgi:hypothetical protein